VPIPFVLVENRDVGGHEYRTYSPAGDPSWMESLAREYVDLRTACASPLNDVVLEGIEIVDVEQLRRRLHQAALPQRRGGSFDVLRSDLGEVLAYELLQQEFGMTIGYKSVRDRELPALPGRGIDAIGVEAAPPTTDGRACYRLVLAETKVSDENRSPPRVVDASEDCLRDQHLAHLSDRRATISKIFQHAQRMTDTVARERLLSAALMLERDRLDRLSVVACCVLVRSQARCAESDSGSFEASPADYAPANIRFLRIQLPDDVESVINAWTSVLSRTRSAA